MGLWNYIQHRWFLGGKQIIINKRPKPSTFITRTYKDRFHLLTRDGLELIIDQNKISCIAFKKKTAIEIFFGMATEVMGLLVVIPKRELMRLENVCWSSDARSKAFQRLSLVVQRGNAITSLRGTTMLRDELVFSFF